MVGQEISLRPPFFISYGNTGYVYIMVYYLLHILWQNLQKI